MARDSGRDHTRREFLSATAAAAAAVAFGAVSDARAQAPKACGQNGAITLTPTPSQTEGPYFKPNTPMRASLLEPGMPGTKLVIEGSVLTTDCRPVARALLDFWQADAGGHYDNAGYRLRGHQLTDEAGRYRLETVVPAQYPGRTRHIHVKVQAPGQPALTTQLYFPDGADNRRDSIFDPALVMRVRDVEGGKLATFDFILAGR
jgi:protocatechuate 3,4-dioxygenase beta subunit